MAGAQASQQAERLLATRGSFRWIQLFLGIICMVMIANLQYGWTLFVNPMADKFGWSRAEIQFAFSLFILAETWLVPLEGYLVDRYGPRPVVFVGGLLSGIGWVMNSFADTLTMLYVANTIAGVGAGAVYGTCVGNALKWFPDRRGLAAGLTAAGFGAGSAATVLPITAIIKTMGFQTAFLYFGIGQGLVVMMIAMALVDPRRVVSPGIALQAKKAASPRNPQTKRDYRPLEILRQPVFWVMYLMFVLVAAGGLMATAQLAPIAKDFKIDTVPVTVLWWTLPALSFALIGDRVLNGLTRPFFGWVSDNIGRESTMLIAFLLEGIGIMCLFWFGKDPFMFVILSSLVFFGWGEIYSLFPSTNTDTFGAKFAAANAGLLYTAKGTASLLVPLSSWLTAQTGNWHAVFVAAALMNIAAALLAWFVLRPMRRAGIARSSKLTPAPVGQPA
ncbi:MAG TPA: oxalate/formate MFS antiporter [Casimicrobiaceae bacterium]|nr:oxalate/formate MFS antiporter [Casimicrobiaceae bacterium]